MVKISVIVAIYNVQNYVSACIESIRKQTYRNLEIILVDDGSTDESGKICDKYAEIDNRILVIHKENGGLSDARNAGLDICTGDYIGFIDGDDAIDKDMYELLYKNIQQYNANISMCKEYIIKNGEVYKSYNDEKVSVYKGFSSCLEQIYLGHGLSVSVCVKLYNKELFNNVRFLKGKTTEDGFIVCDLLDENIVMAVQYISKYKYIQRNDSIVHQQKYKKSILDLVEAYEQNHNKIISVHPELMNVSYYRLSWAYRETILRIVLTDDWKEHTDEIKVIQKKLRNIIYYCLVNEYMSIKQKIASIIVLVSPTLYKHLK